MKDYREYLKSKAKPIKGAATLEPPAGGADALQSVASMAVLDLVSEGPIYGLIDGNGKKANNINILESLYLDDTPVLGKNAVEPQRRSLNYNRLTSMGRVTRSEISTALDSISGFLEHGNNVNDFNISFAATKNAQLEAEKAVLLDFIDENPGLSRFGFMCFRIDGVFPTGDAIYSRSDVDATIGVYNQTTFNLDLYHGRRGVKRSLKKDNGETIEMPSPFVYGHQTFNSIMSGGAPNNNVYLAGPPFTINIQQDGQGKVNNKFLMSGFAGGALYFFEIGDNDATLANGDFNSGKFLIERGDPNTQSKIINAKIDKHDLFIFESSVGKISLECPSPNQVSPIAGEIAGQSIQLGWTSDMDLKYNYGNIDFDFRNGFEQQPTIEGHDQGVQDFDIRKKLYGPLSYAGSASAGDGEGYADVRDGGDFSNWMVNPPLQSDSYPYTHTIKRIDVKKATPTIAIEGLSDIIDEGDDAGVQRSETLKVSYRYGFEGGASGNVADLLAAGNTIQQIALGTFEDEDLITYEGIVVSNYLDTYSGIGDLPANKSLKNLVVNSTDIPGLTTSLINQYGLTAGEKIFPGEEWKRPNRFLTIEKKSFETDSTLIERECSISYVSESIKEPFSYPLAATAGTIFDARSFAAAPSRDFEIRGKLISIPSNYEPLNEDGSDKRFISSSKDYGLREIQRFDGSTYCKVYNKINIGTSNFEISARVGFGSISTTSSDYQYIIDKDGGVGQANRVAIFQTNSVIKALIKESTSTNTDFELAVNIGGRNNSHFHANKQYVKRTQNLTKNVDDVFIDSSTSFDIQFDLVIGDFVNQNEILWTAGSHQRCEIDIINGKIKLAVGSLPVGSNDGNGVENTTTNQPGKSSISTRTFSPFEFVQFELEGNLSTGIRLRDRSDNSIIVEITSTQLTDIRNHPNGMVRVTGLYILGVNSQRTDGTGRDGAGAMTNLIVQGTTIFTDDPFGSTSTSQNRDPNFVTFGEAIPIDVYDISLKGIGQKYTLEVKVGDTSIGTVSDTMSTARGNIIYEAGTNFLIGNSANETNTTRLKDGTTVSDVRIRKNNQLIHHWDGTIKNTVRHDNCIKDRIGGYHADIIPSAGANVVLDSSFTYGKNRERIYNGAWDGTFKLGWTDNPAWILYDLMINPIYGIGNAIDDREDINIFNLYKIAQYCDAVDSDGYFDGLPDSTKGLEPRFSCNLRIYESKNAFETLGNIASIFRGFTYWDGIGLNFAIDKDKEISALFNNGNVYDGIFNYADIASSARFTKVEVMYADRNDLYGAKSEYVEDEDGIRKYGVISKMLNGIGCTSKSQARRMGKYVLFSNKMETEIVKFRGASECLFLEPGDIIRIDDEVKNFEVNYGKVLEIKSSTPDPYVAVESNMNPSSVQLGANGGVYLYTNRKQNELENLYDIVKFQTAYQFGEDSDVYQGVVNSDFINESSLTEIQKIQVTGTLQEGNLIKLFLETADPNFENLSGVQTGSFFNVELNNEVDKTFKVIKKTQTESNIFDVEAMQYDLQKFEKIENEDFDDEEITYNVGIPANVINRPATPTNVVHNQFQKNDLTFAITGEITTTASSNETSYRIALYRSASAGPYIEKEVERESDNTTLFRCDGLIDGNYSVRVQALRNPESSEPYRSSFTIEAKKDVYIKPIIKEIQIGKSDDSNYERISGSGFGSGSSNYEDVEYRFVTVDKKDRVFSLTQLDYSLDIYLEKSGEYIPLVEDYEQDNWMLSDIDNSVALGSYNPNYKIKFDLKKDGTVVDSAFFETSVNSV